MDAYLEKLLSQIRCKKARPYIGEELRSHMESQIDDNMSAGMTREEAEKNAVEDMGDPVEVGISLDKIHKPRIAWKLLVIVGILSLLGILIQQSVLHRSAYMQLEPLMQEKYQLTLETFVSSVLFGFIIMCGIYLIDYTVIAKYAKVIGICIIAMGFLAMTGLAGQYTNGEFLTIELGIFQIPVRAVMMLYVPVYGAILYKYRDGGASALLKAAVWLVVPVFVMFRMPNLTGALIMMVSMQIQLTTAILKGWFKVPVKRAIAGVWTVFTLLPVLLVTGMYTFHLLEAYQEARIRAFFTASEEGYYLTSVLRAFQKDILLIGNSGNDVVGNLPGFNSDYIFSYILNSYGSIAGMLVIAALSALVMFVFGSAVKQKNELGLIMGFGCGMIFALNIVINLLGAVGVIPPAASFLPFLSAGRGNILLSYALAGMIMSIYRYKDVYPKCPRKSRDFTLQRTEKSV